ncbi:MAG: glycoside hydrolase family 16 protein [Burkholderiales bacterium]|nr:glycoside hydrolase family 16 protein [Burkholderiales bacterium]
MSPPARALAGLAVSLLAACGGGGEPAAVDADSQAVAPANPVTPPVPTPGAPATPTLPPQVPAGYALVWADEFDVAGLPDATRWAYDTERNALGWYNNELQYYAAARPQNAVVSNGRLRIVARAESLSGLPDWGGQRYSSARLITRGLAAWTYGFFEVRAKLPCGRGTWPAIWMLGTSGPWPVAGEIDIMEHVGSNPGRVFGTVHTQVSAGPGTGAAVQVPDACTAFHDYQLHWTADELAIGIDGVVYYRYPNPRAGRTTWPFDAPQYLLLNIAIGGTLGGAVDDTIFPVTMEIEHVRVYQARP